MPNQQCQSTGGKLETETDVADKIGNSQEPFESTLGPWFDISYGLCVTVQKFLFCG